MEPLNGFDSFVLYEERGNTFNHVAALCLYEAPTGTPGRRGIPFDGVARQIRALAPSVPAFRRRLVEAPMALDRPHWQDADIDFDFHVRRVVLRPPADWAELMREVARLHARPLDRTRPLWEAHVIEGLDAVEGLPPGSFALFVKVHHAVADGLATVEIVRRLHALEPRIPRPAARARAAGGTEGGGSAAALYRQALAQGTGRLLVASRLSLRTAGKAATLAFGRLRKAIGAGEADAAPDAPLPTMSAAPLTRFSAPISSRRVVEGVALPIATVAKIRRAMPGTTINDVLLAVAGGAMRRYLAPKGELPERSLVTLMPISLRAPGSEGGNEVGGVPVRLRTDVADARERLVAVAAEARRAVAQAGMLGLDLPKAMFEIAPHLVAHFIAQRLIRQFNTTVSNVRGPQAPLFMAGARLARFYPVSIPAECAGLNHTIVSYDGTLFVGIVSCPEMLPDAARYALCVRESFAELERAAASKTEVSAVEPRTEAPAVAARRRRATAAEAARKPRRG